MIGSDAFSFGHNLSRRFLNAFIVLVLALIWTIWSPWIAGALLAFIVTGWLMSDRFTPILIVPEKPARARKRASKP